MTAAVYHNHGRWVANCPADQCSEAHAVTPGDGFMCVNCGMVSKLGWPLNMEQLTRTLSLRSVPETRNWLPGETLDDLVAENLEHKVGV